MMEASITPGMVRTRFSRSSESMIAPTFLCRGSEGRGAPISAGLRVPHFPGGPPGTCGSREDPHVIAVGLDPEHLVTSGDGLTRREPEHLAAGSPGEVIRDYAMKTGELSRAIAFIKRNYNLGDAPAEHLDVCNYGAAVYLSQLLAASGLTQQAVARAEERRVC